MSTSRTKKDDTVSMTTVEDARGTILLQKGYLHALLEGLVWLQKERQTFTGKLRPALVSTGSMGEQEMTREQILEAIGASFSLLFENVDVLGSELERFLKELFAEREEMAR